MKKEKTTQAAIIDLIDEQEFENFTDAPIKSNRKQEKTPSSFIDKMTEKEEIKIISAERCAPWHLADRQESEMGDIKSLALSIKAYGQQEPILARPTKDKNSSFEFEIIFGNRRWQACKLINSPIKAIIKNISDEEAAIAQKEENENRKDISDYSKAVHYKSLLNKNVFSNMSELSQKMGISKATLSDLMSYTRINDKVLAAIKCPSKISRKAAAKLAALSNDISDKSINILIKVAKGVEDGKVSARQIEDLYKKLATEQVSEKTPNALLEKNHIKTKQKRTGETEFVVKSILNNEQIEEIKSFIESVIVGIKLVRPGEQD